MPSAVRREKQDTSSSILPGRKNVYGFAVVYSRGSGLDAQPPINVSFRLGGFNSFMQTISAPTASFRRTYIRFCFTGSVPFSDMRIKVDSIEGEVKMWDIRDPMWLGAWSRAQAASIRLSILL